MEATIPTQNSRTTWVKTGLALGVILLTAAFLRLYRIADYLTFLGDEGRDVLIVKHLLEGDLVGLGPTASVGGFFTGPAYYYFMAPFLWLFKLDPVGPAVMVALFGIATVFLVYWVGKEFFDRRAALIAASLYAVSPLIVGYSRSSWNPNPLPFFSLLTIFVVYKAVLKKSMKYFFVVGVLLGIALQLHYIATFLIAVIVLYIFVIYVRKLHALAKTYLSLFTGFLVGFSPFLAFEITHGFQNIQTVIKFIFGGTGETGFAGQKFFVIVTDVFFRLFGRLLTRFPPPEQITFGINNVEINSYGFVLQIPVSVLYILTLGLAIGSVALLISRWKHAQYTLLLLWLVVGTLLFGFYKKPIYDYYFAFMFPLPFLFVGMLFSHFWERFGSIGKGIIGGTFVFLLLLNFDGRSMKYEPNRQLAQVRSISEFVMEKAEGKPFNFALITAHNSDHGYRYFFELEGNPPVVIQTVEKDLERKTVMDQLLVVCEDTSCKPLGHSLWEVSGFGRAEIVGQWGISVVKVYKLVHFQGENE